MGFDNGLGAFKEFVKRDYLRRYQMSTEELKRGVLVLIDSGVWLKLLKGADNNHRTSVVKKQLLTSRAPVASWFRLNYTSEKAPLT
jgi:hypothetical protein